MDVRKNQRCCSNEKNERYRKKERESCTAHPACQRPSRTSSTLSARGEARSIPIPLFRAPSSSSRSPATRDTHEREVRPPPPLARLPPAGNFATRCRASGKLRLSSSRFPSSRRPARSSHALPWSAVSVANPAPSLPLPYPIKDEAGESCRRPEVIRSCPSPRSLSLLCHGHPQELELAPHLLPVVLLAVAWIHPSPYPASPATPPSSASRRVAASSACLATPCVDSVALEPFPPESGVIRPEWALVRAPAKLTSRRRAAIHRPAAGSG